MNHDRGKCVIEDCGLCDGLCPICGNFMESSSYLVTDKYFQKLLLKTEVKAHKKLIIKSDLVYKTLEPRSNDEIFTPQPTTPTHEIPLKPITATITSIENFLATPQNPNLPWSSTVTIHTPFHTNNIHNNNNNNNNNNSNSNNNNNNNISNYNNSNSNNNQNDSNNSNNNLSKQFTNRSLFTTNTPTTQFTTISPNQTNLLTNQITSLTNQTTPIIPTPFPITNQQFSNNSQKNTEIEIPRTEPSEPTEPSKSIEPSKQQKNNSKNPKSELNEICQKSHSNTPVYVTNLHQNKYWVF